MSKRRVSKKQLGRIAQIQQQREANWRDGTPSNESPTDQDYGPEQPGLLVAHFGKMSEVESPDGHRFRCRLRQHLGDLVCGDQVLWREGPHRTGVITAVLARRSILGRHNEQGEVRPVAANIDQLLIVVACEPALILYLLDSYLVAAEIMRITPVIIANKMDLLTPEKTAELTPILAYYEGLGYSVIRTACPVKGGLTDLHRHLKEKTSVFVGQSGVGKSTLIAHVLPEHGDIKTGELSRGQGMHTTTTARLYHLPGGGQLIDSPGIREFGLGKLNLQVLERGFIDFHPFLGQCKFRNCDHSTEPLCAVKQAVTQGKIAASRLGSFHHLLRPGEV